MAFFTCLLLSAPKHIAKKALCFTILFTSMSLQAVNINTASLSEIADALPGVGPKTAAAIIEYRQNNGEFNSIEDLLGVSGIGASTLENLRPHIDDRSFSDAPAVMIDDTDATLNEPTSFTIDIDENSSDGRLDINTASAEELATIMSGVGEKTAIDIVQHRAAFGAFDSVDALADVPGIGAATIDKNRDQLMALAPTDVTNTDAQLNSFAIADEEVIEQTSEPNAQESSLDFTNTDDSDPIIDSGQININTASLDRLQLLNNIGPVKARRIIEYRQANGQFTSIEELANIKGIGSVTIDKNRYIITF